jgi:hypothetical protein
MEARAPQALLGYMHGRFSQHRKAPSSMHTFGGPKDPVSMLLAKIRRIYLDRIVILD